MRVTGGIGPFQAGGIAGRQLWRHPLAPLLFGLLLLGWELGLAAATRPLLGRLLRNAWEGQALFPMIAAIAVVALAWNAMLAPFLGQAVVLVEVEAAATLPLMVANLAGVGTVGLFAALANAGSQACLLAALLAATRRRLLGGGPIASALLWALPAAPALLLGSIAGGAALLATARIGAGDESARTPSEGLHALGSAAADLLRQPLRTSAVFSALLIITSPFIVAAAFLGMAGLVARRRLARLAFGLGGSLCASAALLWTALGLRLALQPDSRVANEAVVQ